MLHYLSKTKIIKLFFKYFFSLTNSKRSLVKFLKYYYFYKIDMTLMEFKWSSRDKVEALEPDEIKARALQTLFQREDHLNFFSLSTVWKGWTN